MWKKRIAVLSLLVMVVGAVSAVAFAQEDGGGQGEGKVGLEGTGAIWARGTGSADLDVVHGAVRIRLVVVASDADRAIEVVQDDHGVAAFGHDAALAVDTHVEVGRTDDGDVATDRIISVNRRAAAYSALRGRCAPPPRGIGEHPGA